MRRVLEGPSTRRDGVLRRLAWSCDGVVHLEMREEHSARSKRSAGNESKPKKRKEQEQEQRQIGQVGQISQHAARRERTQWPVGLAGLASSASGVSDEAAARSQAARDYLLLADRHEHPQRVCARVPSRISPFHTDLQLPEPRGALVSTAGVHESLVSYPAAIRCVGTVRCCDHHPDRQLCRAQA